MTANLQCTDTHFFPKHPSPGFASRAPKIMPVEGNCYPNLQKGLHAKPNVLYGNWQIPEILPRDPARPDIEHFLQLEVHGAPSRAAAPRLSFLPFRRARALQRMHTKTHRSTPLHPSQMHGTPRTFNYATPRPWSGTALWCVCSPRFRIEGSSF
jgi:hypothetical protein